MKRFNISVDVERDIRTGSFNGVEKGLKYLEKLMDKYKIKPTLFVTGEVVLKYGSYLKKLQDKGWEIGCHSFEHDRFDEMDNKEKENDLKKCIEITKKNNIKLEGFRAPQHSISNKDLLILNKLGFKYDSSFAPLNAFQLIFFPKKVKLGVKQFFSKISPHYRNGILEIPSSSFFIPLVAVSLRLFPMLLIKLLINFMWRRKVILFYAHSWDFIKLEKSRIYKICPLDRFVKKLDKMLNYMDKKGEFVKLNELR